MLICIYKVYNITIFVYKNNFFVCPKKKETEKNKQRIDAHQSILLLHLLQKKKVKQKQLVNYENNLGDSQKFIQVQLNKNDDIYDNNKIRNILSQTGKHL